jgi:excisionase family DNA binding protein
LDAKSASSPFFDWANSYQILSELVYSLASNVAFISNNAIISPVATGLTQSHRAKENPMKDQEVLDPANDAEADMAAIAHQCLMTALDHSKADHINIILDVSEEGEAKHETPVLKLPPRALRFFADVLRQMAKQEPMLLVPQKHELTTQEAANFLNVSRPFVIKEIEANRLACRKVNRHRRIEFEELRRYQAAQQQQSEQALQDLTKLSEELGLEL